MPIINKTAQEWFEQGKTAMEELMAKGAKEDSTMEELAAIDPDAFKRMVQAGACLGMPLGKDILEAAGIHGTPVVVAINIVGGFPDLENNGKESMRH